MSVLSTLRAMFPPPDWRSNRAIDAEINEEFAFHRAMIERDLHATGASPEAAAQQADQRFGDVAKLRRECRNITRGSRNMLGAIGLLISATMVFGISQTEDKAESRWARLAPFTGVRWVEQQPEIEHDGRWYRLLSIDGLTTPEILAHCTQAFPGKERKRFSEDLVEVLAGMGHQPGEAVDLVVRDAADGREIRFADVPMSKQNRTAVWQRNVKDPTVNPPRPAAGEIAPSQGDPWARLSPFTAVRWNGDDPEVELDGRWYALDAIDGIPTDHILEHCAVQFPGRERKRFSEDLVEVLSGMGHAPGGTVSLRLADLETGSPVERPAAAMTAENRGRVRDANRAAEKQPENAGEAAPPVARIDARAADATSREQIESEWERYTREFIARYKLDQKQTTIAERLLRRCQSRGNDYVTRRRAAFQEAGRSGDAERLDALRAPIGEIFEKQLKPGLDRIPTRAQRAAAESSPR